MEAVLRRQDERHIPYQAVLEALETGHCPLCLLGRQAAQRYIAELIHDGVTSPASRDRTRRAQELCRAHTWYMRHHGGVPGMFMIYRDVVRDVAVSLGATLPERPAPGPRAWLRRLLRRRRLPAAMALANALAPAAPCPACEMQARAERMYAEVFLDYLDDAAIKEHLKSGHGLCLDHLRLALERVPDEDTLARLVEAERELFDGALNDLDHLIAHLDHTRREPGLLRTAGAGILALNLVAGEEGLV